MIYLLYLYFLRNISYNAVIAEVLSLLTYQMLNIVGSLKICYFMFHAIAQFYKYLGYVLQFYTFSEL